MGEWIRSTEVKRMLGRSKKNMHTLKRLRIEKKLIPVSMHGTTHYYDINDVEDYMRRERYESRESKISVKGRKWHNPEFIQEILDGRQEILEGRQ